MDLDLGVIWSALFAVLGCVWIYEVTRRWRSDLEELRTSTDRMAKGVIVGFWIVTLVVAWVLLDFVLGVRGRIAEAF